MSALLRRRTAVLFLAAFLWSGATWAETIREVSSGGFAAAYKELAPAFEKETGHTLVTNWGPSMGETPQAVPQRLARGEPIDVLIMVGYALDGFVKHGTVDAASVTQLARSGIGVVVKAGARHPDVATVNKLRQALLAAKSIAYSDSASGVYIQNEMFRKLGIQEQVVGKARMIPAEPVGQVVARGEAEIGFQQISELKPITGIELVGPLPPEVQQFTVFSAGVVARSTEPGPARELIRFLAAPHAAPAIRDSGMEPLGSSAAR